ncbi:MAG: PrsW family glutamic-type intramembrane protease [Spirochaetota bacterium]
MKPLFNFLNDPWLSFLAFLSIAPWAYALYHLHPPEKRKFLSALVGFAAGILSTYLILYFSEILFPQVNLSSPRRKVSILTQTLHIAFIQASMMEETVKSLFILSLSWLLAHDKRKRLWQKNVILIAGFVALGFSIRENFLYFSKTSSSDLFNLFIGRTIHSSNIHLLINLCFALFLLKSNQKFGRDFFLYLGFAFIVAVLQHGVVDFFLLPGVKFGSWLATSMFVGIWVWVVKDMRRYVYLQTS